MHLAVCDVLFKNRSVTHIAGKDYDYDDDQDEEGFGIVIPTTPSNKIPLFNVEIEKVLKKVVKVLVKNEVLQKYVLLVKKQGVVTCPRL